MRSTWPKYYHQEHSAILFVIDAADAVNATIAMTELQKIVHHPDLKVTHPPLSLSIYT